MAVGVEGGGEAGPYTTIKGSSQKTQGSRLAPRATGDTEVLRGHIVLKSLDSNSPFRVSICSCSDRDLQDMWDHLGQM